MTISENQLKTLRVMHSNYCGNEHCDDFSEYGHCESLQEIGNQLKTTRDKARIYVRALARKGLVELAHLFRSEDEPFVAGSGYYVTTKGCELLAKHP